MASFETIFRIPSSHVFKAKFHSYGAGVPESWSHEEYDGYGIRTFDSVLRTSAMVNPAAIVANRAHPALIVLGPGGL